MKVESGKTYELELRTKDAALYGPSWLAGAIATSFPRAQLVSYRDLGAGKVAVKVRWDRSDEIETGQVLSPGGAPLQMIGPSPTARVMNIQESDPIVFSEETGSPIVNLVLSGAILATVCYLSARVEP